MRQRLRSMSRCLAVGAVAMLASHPAEAQKFYPDDPLTAEPPPYATYEPQARALSDIMELASNTVGSPGERHPASGVIKAGGVNTMGEVLDGPWFVNRHATRRLTRDELVRGPGIDHPPMADEPWQLLSVRPYGSRPGILIADGRDRLYLLLFDSSGSLEMSTGAQMVSSRIAHAIGYHVPEAYIVTFERDKLVLAEGAEIVSSAGNTRALTEEDLDILLPTVARTRLGRYRAVALYVSPPEWAGLLGPYQVYATRSDDPNDIVPHEHRRDLRGLFVISAWLNHATIRAVATHDILIDDGVVPPHIRHHLIDFWATLGGGFFDRKRAWDGNDTLFDSEAALKNILGFGVWSPGWMRASYPSIPAVGRFESATFDPARWIPVERLATFENRLPDDEYWGAKQVMAFTDDDIRALVSTGEYTDPEAAEWITDTLIARRDAIGRHYFAKMLPLDNFRVEDGRLVFDDLAERYGVSDGPRTYTGRWLRVFNDTGALAQLGGADSLEVPDEVDRAAAGSYFAVRNRGHGRGLRAQHHGVSAHRRGRARGGRGRSRLARQGVGRPESRDRYRREPLREPGARAAGAVRAIRDAGRGGARPDDDRRGAL